uniref:RING-type E3 ubiquitin transferase n=1 Tax=Leersia perrieri TaxID=77586 RepID=A0A0D9X7T7_9ORYZ
MPPPPTPPLCRRMLALPAVCPCEDISPDTLLSSLATLAADVAAGCDVAALPALRTAAAAAVRVAGLLRELFEELKSAAAALALTGGAVLGLSELHVALQKMRFLLEDCARKGARMWVLMNAEAVASELRVGLGSVATAMDVLLPAAVFAAASDDARELAALVSRQSWRAAVRLRPDGDDALAAASVRSMLARFSYGVTPDADDARLVLARVGVAGWWECSHEVSFLEAELLDRLDAGGENDNDLVLISGLMSFLLYCRVVLFDRIDDAPVAETAARPASYDVNPEALQCPITLELMTDPVTLSTGQTYDRASIKRWVKSGCRTCPVTGEKLRRADVMPNLAVRAIVEHLLLTNGVSPPHEANSRSSSKHRVAVDKTASPFGAAAAGGARLAAAFVVSRLSGGSTDDVRKATQEARRLSKRNVFHRGCLVDAGAVPWLLHHLASADAAVQDNAVAGLLNLSKHHLGRAALVGAGGLGLIVDAVNVAVRVESRQNAAAIIFYLSSDAACSGEIGRIPEAIPTLVRLIRDGAYRGRKNALTPGLMPSLYALIADGGAQGSKKARWIVNEIHRHYEQRQPPAVAAPPPAGDRVIRV